MTDPLNNETEISVKLDETGLSAKTKSRFFAAFDRLLGNWFDKPNAFMEQKSNIARAETAAKVEVIKAMGEAAAQSVKDNPDLARAFMEKSVGEEFFKLENKEKIVQKTIEVIIENPDKLQSEQTDDSLDPDWMNSFVAFSERASSESLQVLWARVLTGEITKPGSYSLSTLRIISEIGPKTAKLFESYMEYILGDDNIVSLRNLKGPKLTEMLELENAGLVVQSAAGLGIDLTLDSDGILKFDYNNFSLRLKGKKAQKVRLSIVKLSNSGKEIKNIIPSKNSYAALDLFGEDSKESLEEVSIHDLSGKLVKKIK